MPAQLLHVSDTHLGKQQYRSTDRRDDYAAAFAEAIDTAVRLDVDAVIHTGDLFDAPNPSVPVVNQCLDVLATLSAAAIQFYGIVGNHERKPDDQWLDLVDRFDLVERLTREPTYVGTGDDRVALYGIDAVRKPQWTTTDFTLTPPADDAFVLLCMHELLSPPVPAHMADYETDAVLDRTELPVDGLALGDYHEAESAMSGDTRVWYPGSTEKTARDESPAHVVVELTYDTGDFSRTSHTLTQPREFVELPLTFADGDGLAATDQQISAYDLAGANGKAAVGIAVLNGAKTGVTPQDVHKLLAKHGAAVTQVVDQRGVVDTDALDAGTVDTSEIESLLDDSVESLSLSTTTQRLESLARDETVTTTALRDRAAETLDEALTSGDSE